MARSEDKKIRTFRGFKVQVTQIFGFYIFSYFKNMESNRGFHKVFFNFGFCQACLNELQTLAFLVFVGTVFL